MQTNRPLNRILSLALCLILILGITPVSVFAEDAPDGANLGASYHTGDIAAINNIITTNWTNDETRPELAPEDGSSIPESWTSEAPDQTIQWEQEWPFTVIWSDDTSNRRVTQLYVIGQNLTGELDVSGTALEYLDCKNNKLESLNVSGCTELKELCCFLNQLTALDVSGCTALSKLECDTNKLTELDVSDCVSLKTLMCFANEFTKPLDLSGMTSLEKLNCSQAKITTLDVSGCTQLTSLECLAQIGRGDYPGTLTSVNLKDCTAIEYLRLDDQKLTRLDVTGLANLQKMNVSGNYLPSKEAVIGFTGTWDGVNFVFDPQRGDTPPVPPSPGGPNGGGSSGSGGSSSGRSSSSSRGSSTPDSFRSSTTTQAANSPVDVTTAAATTAAKDAAAKAKSEGASTATATIKNPGNISLAALNAMAKEAGMPLKLQADSMTPDGKAVDVRITLDPAQSIKGLNLAASTTGTRTKNTVSHFQKWFSNNLMAVSFEQTDSFGQSVEIAVKPIAGLNTANLVFYSHNRTANTYTRIANPAYSVDRNGYIHFTTTHGGDIVISDGVLSRA